LQLKLTFKIDITQNSKNQKRDITLKAHYASKVVSIFKIFAVINFCYKMFAVVVV